MNRLRTCAAMLSIATLIVAAIFLFLPAIGLLPVIPLVIGAGALAFVAPFEAMDRPARRRVLIAALIHLVATVATLALLALADEASRPLFVVMLLTIASAVVAGWAFKTRNRRRRVGWNDYYD